MKAQRWDEFAKGIAIQTCMQDVRLSYLAKCIVAVYLLEPGTSISELVGESTDYAESQIIQAVEQLRQLGYLDLLQSITNQRYYLES